jgi:hypothetical protein
MKRNYVSFKVKLVVAAVTLTLEAIILGGFWVALALAGDDRSLDAPELPPLASLTETSGTIAVITFSTSRKGGTQYRPIVEFSANGILQQIGTRASYSEIPFRRGDNVVVLYNSAAPDKSWLKWEYDRYYREANTPGFKEIIRTIFNFGALGILGLTVLFLLYYFVKPVKND